MKHIYSPSQSKQLTRGLLCALEITANGNGRSEAAIPEPVPFPGLQRKRSRRWPVVTLLLLMLVLLSGLAFFEIRTSWGQARLLSAYTEKIRFDLQPGPSNRIHFPKRGPYDLRFGYAEMPDILERMRGQPFRITAQAHVSERFDEAVAWGLFPIYREKNQAGLRIMDRSGATFYEIRYPRHIYATFEDIPPLVWRTLLYIENRNLLDPALPYNNPAIEWGRFSRALADEAMNKLGIDRAGAGASTLATQLEKLRHSPGGLTDSAPEKLRQMATASFRSYLNGPETMEAQRRIIRDYLNAMPLAAVAGYGEVTGLGDGLWAWYSVDVRHVNDLLTHAPDTSSVDALAAQAVAYRQVLSLFLADRRPSYFLRQQAGRAALEKATDDFLRILERDGVIPTALRDAALAALVPLRPRVQEADTTSFVERKAANALRAELLGRLGTARLYDLDHYDLTVRSTFDAGVQQEVATLLAQLGDPAFVRVHELGGYRLLGQGDPDRVSYAIVLYEAAAGGNLVRVHVDNFDGPFDINKGAKLELGSTAKLRTLVTYLQIVNTLHQQYAALPAARLHAIPVDHADHITAWGLGYLARHPGVPVSAMLEAALDRRYSAHSGERFYTGGGLHVFQNFSGADDSLAVPVRDAFRRSVNLVFIRLMRDIVSYHRYRLPGAPTGMLNDRDDPRRAVYLARFADREGRAFSYAFYRRYRGMTGAKVWTTFTAAHGLTPQRLAWAYRAVMPEAERSTFATFIRTNADASLSDERIESLYQTTDPRAFSWQDRGYLAGVHPLELWLLQYLQRHPAASWEEIAPKGASVRQEVYGWLLNSKNKGAQDWRIRTLLEEEVFAEIHTGWKNLGYPFDSLVPSYATAIGSSADRPDALAELVGIVLRGGMRYPARQIEEMHFGAGTPFETVLEADPPRPLRVLSPEVAAVVRHAMTDVVERGTAVRARAAVTLSNGTVLPLGGKTGTGDNRRDQFGSGGRLIGSHPLNRTATFVFFIGDRFFGVVTVFVSGTEADNYRFTSSLPTQVLKTLGPMLRPLFEGVPAVYPAVQDAPAQPAAGQDS